MRLETGGFPRKYSELPNRRAGDNPVAAGIPQLESPLTSGRLRPGTDFRLPLRRPLAIGLSRFAGQAHITSPQRHAL